MSFVTILIVLHGPLWSNAAMKMNVSTASCLGYILISSDASLQLHYFPNGCVLQFAGTAVLIGIPSSKHSLGNILC